MLRSPLVGGVYFSPCLLVHCACPFSWYAKVSSLYLLHQLRLGPPLPYFLLMLICSVACQPHSPFFPTRWTLGSYRPNSIRFFSWPEVYRSVTPLILSSCYYCLRLYLLARTLRSLEKTRHNSPRGHIRPPFFPSSFHPLLPQPVTDHWYCQ